ncbi:MAG: FHA domain-containing protein [Oscillospiraceae bacterium]|nr:FHA domain-containing protein [Oscillospiraceae bacterium]
MNMKLCPNSHYYDSLQYSECPHCKAANANANAAPGATPIGATVPIMNNNADIGATVPVFNQPAAAPASDIGATMPIMREKHGTDPVVGWLVCVAGNAREIGKDYRIRTGYNYIGRSPKMDISIESDDTISRENHATVAYAEKAKRFMLAPSQGKAIISVNDEPIMGTVELKAYDTIELSEITKLKFVPFCGESFEWGGKEKS